MSRELLINALLQETRVALLENGALAEIYLERAGTPGIVGNIYRGRISNVLPGMQSAFVDIGLERDAFLCVTDVLPPHEDPVGGMEDARPALGPTARRGPAVETLLRENQEILVQVLKEGIGGKGPRVTAQISLPGRCLVFLPGSPHRAVSRRIEAQEEKERLLSLVASIPGEGGFIVRTAAQGAPEGRLEGEAARLRAVWEKLRENTTRATVPSCAHAENDLILKVLRDFLTPEIDRVLVDREDACRRCREVAEHLEPDLSHRIEHYMGTEPIFEAFGVEKDLARALRRRLWLPSGGYIVIHPTEALVAIDVNTGKYLGTTRFEETALCTNLEAVREIVRQIRLRDLGGILVIDFIDLEEEGSRKKLATALEAELKKDRAKSRVLQISDFGLVEITRQRSRRSLESFLCRPCPVCHGSGRMRSARTLRFDIQREVRKVAPLLGGAALTIRAHPEVAGEIQKDLELFRSDLGVPIPPEIRVEAVGEFHPEQYEILTG